MLDLNVLLNYYHAGFLNELIDALRLPTMPKNSRKVHLIDLLTKTFSEPTFLTKQLSNLSPTEQFVLTFLQEVNGSAHTEKLSEKLLLNKLISKSKAKQSFFYKGLPSFDDLIASLVYKGLLFTYDHLSLSSKISFQPGSLAQLNPHLFPLLPSVELNAPPFQQSGSSRTLMKNLGQYTRYVTFNKGVQLTTTGIIYKKDFKNLTELLSIPAESGSGETEETNPAYHFLRLILNELGLLTQPRYQELEAKIDLDFWTKTPHDQMSTLLDTWLDTDQLMEIKWLASYKSGSYLSEHRNLLKARSHIMIALGEIGMGWKKIESLYTYFAINNPNFLWPNPGFGRSNPNQYSASYKHSAINFINPNPDTYRTSWLSSAESWKYIEEAYIEKIIMGPLFWLGLVDLGFDEEVTPTAVFKLKASPAYYRLTDMGAWLLELIPPPTISEESGGLIVQPNFEILAIEPVSQQLLFNLEQFSNSHGVGDRVTTFTIDRQSVYRGQQNDWPVPKIISFLEKESGRPLPGNLKRSLEEWEELHHRITIYHNISALELSSSELGEQLATKLQATQLSPTLFVNLNYQTFKKQILKLNHFPVISEIKDNKYPPDSIQIDKNGAIKYQHPVPSIYTHKIISPITIEKNGTLHIFPAKLKAHLSENKTDLNRLLDQLDAIHVGDLDPELTMNLKAWANYYGTVKHESIIIFEFETVDLRNELCDEPILEKLLRPFKHNLPFAIADPKDFAKIEIELDKLAVIRKIGIDYK